MSWAYDVNGVRTWVPWIVGEPGVNNFLKWDGTKWIPSASGGGGTTVTSGTATIDFGASMVQETTLAVTGQTGIVAGSNVDAWIIPTATADHSADEHMVDPPAIFVGSIVAGTGFTIYANAYSNLGSQTYGKWSVAWQWS